MALVETARDLIAARLSFRAPLSPCDLSALATLPLRTRDVRAGQYLVREGQVPQRCGLIVSGYACRQKLTQNGDREIVAVMLPGDFFDLQNIHLTHSDHDVLALTPVVLADFPIADALELVDARPAIARAMWIDCLVDTSVAREWLLNNGRRDARARLAHLLCELHVRHRQAVTGYSGRFELPLTQEQLGDALGLTPVHVNRMFQSLKRDGVVQRSGRELHIADWGALCDAGDFNERYLHMTPQVQPA